MPIIYGSKGGLVGGILACLLASAPAHAQLAISQLVVELTPPSARTADIEILNDSEERSFVSIEPRQLLAPGMANTQDVAFPDPEKIGLLVSPARMVLEPHERKTMRVAALGALAELEKVYRIKIKPVTGPVTSETSGLKLLVGYDMLVLVRPASLRQDIAVTRQGQKLVLTNRGNASVELAEGKQCDQNGRDCQALPGKRLYAGATWEQLLPRATPVEYRVRSAEGWTKLGM